MVTLGEFRGRRLRHDTLGTTCTHVGPDVEDGLDVDVVRWR